MRLTVIIPVHNQADFLKRSLAALTAAIGEEDEIVVVDDVSTDPIAGIAADAGARVVRLEGAAHGPAVARNRGAETAQGDILFFVDADVVVHADAPTIIRKAFADDPSLSACFGSYDDSPADQGLISQYRNLLHCFTHQNSSVEASSFWAGCGAIRRSVFETAGGFSSEFEYPSIEDVELGYRLKAAGGKIQLIKTLQGTHLKHWSLVSVVVTDFFHRALPWTALLKREGSIMNDMNLTMSSRASAALVCLLPITLIAACWYHWSLAASGMTAIVLLLLNYDFYRFLQKRKGILFTIAAIPHHWFYFFYSTVAFVVGTMKHWASQLCVRPTPKDTSPSS